MGRPNKRQLKAQSAGLAADMAPKEATFPEAKVPVAQRERDLFEMDPVCSHLPYQFPTRKFTLTHFAGLCGGCRGEIPADLIRGRFDKTLDSVVVLEAVGACMTCRLFTRFDYRLHDDGSFSAQRNGSWMRWESRPVFSLTRWLGRLARQVGAIASLPWVIALSFLSVLGSIVLRLRGSAQKGQTNGSRNENSS